MIHPGESLPSQNYSPKAKSGPKIEKERGREGLKKNAKKTPNCIALPKPLGLYRRGNALRCL